MMETRKAHAPKETRKSRLRRGYCLSRTTQRPHERSTPNMSENPTRSRGSSKSGGQTRPSGMVEYLFPRLANWKAAKLKEEDPTPDNKGSTTNPTGGNSDGVTGQLDSHDSSGESQYPSLDARPHRDWVPAPGRIKKCDFCEKRSQHVVHRCTRCPVLMCQDCAFNGTWKTDKHHSISPEKLNWEYAGTRKPRGSGPTTQPALPASGDSASRSDDTNKTDSSRTKRQVHFVSDDTVEDDTELSAPKRQRKTQSSIAHDSSPHDSTSAASETTDQLDEEGQGEYDEDSLPDHPAVDEEEEDDDDDDESLSATDSSEQPHQSSPYREPGAYPVQLTAAAGRSSVRASAAMAMHRMSTPGRRFQDNMNHLAAGANNQAHAAWEQNRPRMLEHPPAEIIIRGHNSVPHYPMPRRGPYTGPFSSRLREKQVMSLYHDIFGPAVEVYRPMALDLTEIPRTIEPNVMENLAYHEPPLPGLRGRVDFRQGRNMRTEPPEHAIYHRQVQEYMMTGGYYDQARSLPPPPPNYAEESFHNYPDKLGYTPTLRSTPIWHPMNEMSPEELRIMHNDHLLQNRMADAWQNNRIVMRVREFGLNAWNLTNWVPKGGPGEKDFEALQLLWEVAQVRINRLLLLVAPQTKKWFADELQRVFFKDGGDSEGQAGNVGVGESPGLDMNVKREVDAAGDVDVNVDMAEPVQKVEDEDEIEEDKEDQDEEKEDEEEEEGSPEHDDDADSDYDPESMEE